MYALLPCRPHKKPSRTAVCPLLSYSNIYESRMYEELDSSGSRHTRPPPSLPQQHKTNRFRFSGIAFNNAAGRKGPFIDVHEPGRAGRFAASELPSVAAHACNSFAAQFFCDGGVLMRRPCALAGAFQPFF